MGDPEDPENDEAMSAASELDKLNDLLLVYESGRMTPNTALLLLNSYFGKTGQRIKLSEMEQLAEAVTIPGQPEPILTEEQLNTLYDDQDRKDAKKYMTFVEERIADQHGITLKELVQAANDRGFMALWDSKNEAEIM